MLDIEEATIRFHRPIECDEYYILLLHDFFINIVRFRDWNISPTSVRNINYTMTQQGRDFETTPVDSQWSGQYGRRLSDASMATSQADRQKQRATDINMGF